MRTYFGWYTPYSAEGKHFSCGPDTHNSNELQFGIIFSVVLFAVPLFRFYYTFWPLEIAV